MTTLEHEGLVYSSEEDYLATLVPYLLEGVANGEGTVVATHDRNAAALMDALGSAAAAVHFVPASEVYRDLVSAVDAYDRAIAAFLAAGKTRVRAVGEVFAGEGTATDDEWLRYEPIADRLFANDPLQVVCPYDARVLPASVIEYAIGSHPKLRSQEGSFSNPHAIEPRALLRNRSSLAAYPSRAPDLMLAVGWDDLPGARASMMEHFRVALPSERAEEALIAVGELLANGLRHGSGPVDARVWTEPEAVVCRIGNPGPQIDDFVGYRRPAQPEHGQMGLWIARQCADRLDIEHDQRGPIVTARFFR